MFETGETVFTHLRPVRPISLGDCDFVLRNSLTPNERFSEDLANYKSGLGVESGSYSVVHIRLGDEHIKTINNAALPDTSIKFLSIFRYIQQLSDRDLFLIATDSKELSMYLGNKGLQVLPGSVAHFGMQNPGSIAIRDTLLQFFTLKDARSIHQISNYGWGSGFSDTAAILGQIRIEKKKLQELL